MTATVPDPAAEATQMAHTREHLPEPSPPTADGADARPRRLAALGGNTLQTVLATAVVALLVFSLTSNRSLIDRLDTRIDRLDTRIDNLEDKIDARFAEIDARFAEQDAKIDARFAEQDAKIDARFAEQDAKIDEINLKLTALIAALSMTEEVDAAIEGRLLDAP